MWLERVIESHEHVCTVPALGDINPADHVRLGNDAKPYARIVLEVVQVSKAQARGDTPDVDERSDFKAHLVVKDLSLSDQNAFFEVDQQGCTVD